MSQKKWQPPASACHFKGSKCGFPKKINQRLMFVPYKASTSPILSLSTLYTKQILYPYDVLIHTNIGTSCIVAALGTGPQLR